jgi:hypothetical protein
LNRPQYEKILNCVKSNNLVIAKLFLYILARDYNSSKTLKGKKKFEAY